MGEVIQLRPKRNAAWCFEDGLTFEEIARRIRSIGGKAGGPPWWPFTAGWAIAFGSGSKTRVHFWRRTWDDPLTYAVHGKIVNVFEVEAYCGAGQRRLRTDAGMFYPGNFPRCQRCERATGGRQARSKDR
jgi:hypothetical protein